jgi:hypothetical protein
MNPHEVHRRRPEHEIHIDYCGVDARGLRVLFAKGNRNKLRFLREHLATVVEDNLQFRK